MTRVGSQRHRKKKQVGNTCHVTLTLSRLASNAVQRTAPSHDCTPSHLHIQCGIICEEYFDNLTVHFIHFCMELTDQLLLFANTCSIVSCDRVREAGNDAELLHKHAHSIIISYLLTINTPLQPLSYRRGHSRTTTPVWFPGNFSLPALYLKVVMTSHIQV